MPSRSPKPSAAPGCSAAQEAAVDLEIRPATEVDVPLILSFIRELANYERLSHEVVATEEALRDSLFGERRFAEVLLGYGGGSPAGFALFFHTFSTFLGKPGIYLEDLYVKPEFRGAGIGRALLVHLARLARERGCGRLEWSVLDWNEPAIGFYKGIGASPVSGWTVYRLTGEALEELAGR
jgi:GNAT superfamily N-acetyltransferase